MRRLPGPMPSTSRLAALTACAVIAAAAAAYPVADEERPADRSRADVAVHAAGAGITPVRAAQLAEPVSPPRPARAPERGDRTAEEDATVLRGEASWYGPGFAGQPTASGEIYDPSELTAAHRSLPFGTRLEVTNLETGRRVVVRINDRGPYVGGRILDLSEAAASAIGLRASGVAPVAAEILE